MKRIVMISALIFLTVIFISRVGESASGTGEVTLISPADRAVVDENTIISLSDSIPTDITEDITARSYTLELIHSSPELIQSQNMGEYEFSGRYLSMRALVEYYKNIGNELKPGGTYHWRIYVNHYTPWHWSETEKKSVRSKWRDRYISDFRSFIINRQLAGFGKGKIIFVAVTPCTAVSKADEDIIINNLRDFAKETSKTFITATPLRNCPRELGTFIYPVVIKVGNCGKFNTEDIAANMRKSMNEDDVLVIVTMFSRTCLSEWSNCIKDRGYAGFYAFDKNYVSLTDFKYNIYYKKPDSMTSILVHELGHAIGKFDEQYCSYDYAFEKDIDFIRMVIGNCIVDENLPECKYVRDALNRIDKSKIKTPEDGKNQVDQLYTGWNDVDWTNYIKLDESDRQYLMKKYVVVGSGKCNNASSSPNPLMAKYGCDPRQGGKGKNCCMSIGDGPTWQLSEKVRSGCAGNFGWNPSTGTPDTGRSIMASGSKYFDEQEYKILETKSVFRCTDENAKLGNAFGSAFNIEYAELGLVKDNNNFYDLATGEKVYTLVG